MLPCRPNPTVSPPRILPGPTLRRKILLTYAKLKELSYYTIIGEVQLQELKKKLRQVGSLGDCFWERAGMMGGLQAELVAFAETLGFLQEMPMRPLLVSALRCSRGGTVPCANP